MGKLGKRIQRLKKKRPGYSQILDFYQRVREEQNKAKASLNVTPIQLGKEWKDLLSKEGFSLIRKQDFPLDVEASLDLFRSLCRVGKDANPHMAEQVRKIEEAFDEKRKDLEALFKEGIQGQQIDKFADELGIDRNVFLFLIQESSRPSIEAGMEQICHEIDSETWQRGYCPICGSLPSLSLLKEEVGKRYLVCSYCGCQWRIDRLLCPFCSTKEQKSLHYFFAEGEEAHRVDLCETCHQYIKTIDQRRIEDSDPFLEDLATPHLDILASQKGYKRPIPNPWNP